MNDKIKNLLAEYVKIVEPNKKIKSITEKGKYYVVSVENVIEPILFRKKEPIVPVPISYVDAFIKGD